MVLKRVTHRRQDGDPLVYAQRHIQLQGYVTSMAVQKERERISASDYRRHNYDP